jgi:hypothetical protein
VGLIKIILLRIFFKTLLINHTKIDNQFIQKFIYSENTMGYYYPRTIVKIDRGKYLKTNKRTLKITQKFKRH